MNNNSKILWPPGRNDENILLMLTDAFPYMVKTSDYLKVFYINTIRVTCTDRSDNTNSLMIFYTSKAKSNLCM